MSGFSEGTASAVPFFLSPSLVSFLSSLGPRLLRNVGVSGSQVCEDGATAAIAMHLRPDPQRLRPYDLGGVVCDWES